MGRKIHLHLERRKRDIRQRGRGRLETWVFIVACHKKENYELELAVKRVIGWMAYLLCWRYVLVVDD